MDFYIKQILPQETLHIEKVNKLYCCYDVSFNQQYELIKTFVTIILLVDWVMWQSVIFTFFPHIACNLFKSGASFSIFTEFFDSCHNCLHFEIISSLNTFNTLNIDTKILLFYRDKFLPLFRVWVPWRTYE